MKNQTRLFTVSLVALGLAIPAAATGHAQQAISLATGGVWRQWLHEDWPIRAVPRPRWPAALASALMGSFSGSSTHDGR